MRAAGVCGGGRTRGAAGAGRAGSHRLLIVLAVLGVAAAAVAARFVLLRRDPAGAPAVTEPEPNSWFDAPVAVDAATPPMGIPITAPERRPPVPAPVAPAPVRAFATTAPAPFAPVPPPGSAEATDPGLRLPDPRPAGFGSAVATDRIPVATLLAAPPAPLPPAPLPPDPVRPAHRWGLGAYLVAELVFLAVSGLMGLVLAGMDPITPGALAAALGVPTVAAAATALLITRVRGNGPVVDLFLSPTWRDVGLGFAFGFGGLFLTIPASVVYVSVVGEDASSAVGDIFGGIRADPVTALLIVAIVVLVAPLCEEILYRGLLWGGLTRLGANRWLAFAVTTFIFALAHFEWPRAILLLVVALPLGLARVYSDGLLAPVIAHQVNNLLPGVGLYLMLTGAFPVL